MNNAIHTLVPALVGGLHQNAQDPDQAGQIVSAVAQHAASRLLDGGANVDQVDEHDGDQIVVNILHHTPQSPCYKETIAEVWFKDQKSAVRGGFTRWDEGHQRN